MNAKIHLHELVNDKKAAHNANGFEVENNNTKMLKMLKMLWAMLKMGECSSTDLAKLMMPCEPLVKSCSKQS